MSKHHVFGNTLLAGAGPAAIQIAVHLSKGWSTKLALYNRHGSHASRMAEELHHSQNIVKLTVQGDHDRRLSGSAVIERLYDNPKDIDDIWETLILCTPCDQYHDVLKKLGAADWQKLRTVILISPNIGSNDLVRHCLRNPEVISFSSYYGATKLTNSESVISAYTKALKKRIYIGSSNEMSKMVPNVQRFLKSFNVEGIAVRDPVTAECKNITTYVHPPLFLNDFSLNEILRPVSAHQKFMYKLYPEGPITQYTIRSMVRLWKEISSLVEHLGAEPVNLLQFLNDDNYPVPEESLSRDDIERFKEFNEVKQEYLLYIRYSSILIDPFSAPDERGRYFEFSAVPYRKIGKNELGQWTVPRIPHEDYRKLKVIYGLAQKAGLSMPESTALLQGYERHIHDFAKHYGKHKVSLEIFKDTWSHDIEAIASERMCNT
ncbi:opine metallophore biosynthesis dehydrogenase [Fictibacillus aquaticus]|uniref:DUF2338 domain-containing protein n=1 Tax=Fictibacillus aquaticus TaxID=2021314 RepID=A0A235FDN2_9BACL|nr:opine metallophore biosynthesis dehydrogenase [Fictibacillus aquaticus]OYD59312.1 hypothetical protein CGZ90_05315 [Fictibacillus aquaticus]